MVTAQEADKLIPAAHNKSSLKYQSGDTGDIMQDVLDCFRETNEQLAELAPLLKGRTVKDTCSNIWHFVKQNIAYRVDPPGKQFIKEPARVWADKVCDCKSYSVFIASLLHHNGIKGFFRFVSFATDKIPTHVYVVVPSQGGTIKIDCVLGMFNDEKPFTKNYDYSMTEIARLSGIELTPAEKVQQVQQVLAARQAEIIANGNRVSTAREQYYQQQILAIMPEVFEVYPELQYYSGYKIDGIGAPFLSVAPKVISYITSNTGLFSSLWGALLGVFDNSTLKWKSRAAKMKSWTPDQRISFYIQNMTKGSSTGDGNSTGHEPVQYAELWGGARTSGPPEVDDRGKVNCELAKSFNDLLLNKFCGGNVNATVPDGGSYKCSQIMYTSACTTGDPGGTSTGTADSPYDTGYQFTGDGSGGSDKPLVKGDDTILYAGLGLALVYALTQMK